MSLRVTSDEYETLKARVGKGQSDSLATPVVKANKYRAVRKEVGGVGFASAGEALRWRELQFEEYAGNITGLRRQVRYKLLVKGFHVCSLVIDFVYRHAGVFVAEDFKGMILPLFRVKAKLFFALTGKQIVVSKRRR
jgi:Protein of unknown function (DUF1064)